MILRFLETENFLAHKSTSLAFPDSGIFLLSGPSGSGKSSFIIDSMAYALFGAVATRARRQSDLVTRDVESSMSVRATFDFGTDRRVTVARGIDERGSSWAQVYQEKDGSSVLLAEGSAPVGRFVRSELGGMTWQQFYAAFVARQSEIDMLTSLRGSDRKNLVQRMLGMRELEKTADVISENIRRFSAEAEQLESGLEKGMEDEEAQRINQRIEEIQEDIAASKKRLQELQQEVSKTEEELLPLEEAFQKEQKREVLLAEMNQLQERKRILENAAERQKNASPENLQSLREEIKRLREVQEDLRNRYRQAAEKASLLEEMGTLDFNPDQNLSEIQEKVRSAKQEIETVQGNIDLFRKRGKDLQETGRCDLCQRPFASEAERKEVEREIEEALELNQKTLYHLEEQVASWTNEMPEWEQNEKLRRRHEALEERIADIPEKEAPDKIALEGQSVGDKIAKMEARVAEMELALQENFQPEDLQSIIARVSDIRKELPDASSGSEQQKSIVEARLQELRGEQNQIQGRVPELLRQKGENEAILKRHNAVILRRRQEEERIEKVYAKSKLQEDLQNFLRSYQKHLAHEIRPALEEIGSEMIRRVSGGQHRAIHLDDNYEIELENSSGQRIASGMLSGGEAIRASLCLRLALTRLVSSRTGVPVGFLVLDEPLPAQDPGHIERIMELLNSLRPFYKQQFVISHVGNLAVSEEVDYLLQFGEEVQLLRS